MSSGILLNAGGNRSFNFWCYSLKENVRIKCHLCNDSSLNWSTNSLHNSFNALNEKMISSSLFYLDNGWKQFVELLSIAYGFLLFLCVHITSSIFLQSKQWKLSSFSIEK